MKSMRRTSRAGHDRDAGAHVSYLLVFDPPADTSGRHGRGWTLVSYRLGLRCGSVALDAHGAGANASPRVAKAVAVRVLARQGVATRGWHDLELADQFGAYRAIVEPADT